MFLTAANFRYEVPLTITCSINQSIRPSFPSFDSSPSLSFLSLFCKPDYHRVVHIRSINLTRSALRLNLNNGPNQAQTIARKVSSWGPQKRYRGRHWTRLDRDPGTSTRPREKECQALWVGATSPCSTPILGNDQLCEREANDRTEISSSVSALQEISGNEEETILDRTSSRASPSACLDHWSCGWIEQQLQQVRHRSPTLCRSHF